MSGDDSITNLRVLSKSRKKPQEGDLFRCQLPDDSYIWGRVVDIDTEVGVFRPNNLIYIYSYRSMAASVIPVSDRQVPGSLLLPPIMTNNQPWRVGVFETVTNEPFESGEKLSVHQFKDPFSDTYYDGKGNLISVGKGPIGIHGLHSFRTIDDDVSEALGFDLVPFE